MAIHFHNRQTAGALLASALEHYRGNPSVVVYALPRGGVVPGFVVAKYLQVPLSLVIARKIGHPDNEEFAIGAVTETGEPLLDERLALGVSADWLAQTIEQQRYEAARRRDRYLHGQPLLSATGKIAILVDDGVATGHTLRAAVLDVLARRPEKIIVAVPVAPVEVIEMLKKEVDEVVVLDPGIDYLGSVGAYYEDFPQVSDSEVMELLKQKTI